MCTNTLGVYGKSTQLVNLNTVESLTFAGNEEQNKVFCRFLFLYKLVKGCICLKYCLDKLVIFMASVHL